MASTLDGGEHRDEDYHQSVSYINIKPQSRQSSLINPLLQSQSDLLLQYKYSPHGPT